MYQKLISTKRIKIYIYIYFRIDSELDGYSRGGYLKTLKILEGTFNDSVFDDSRLDFYLFLKVLVRPLQVSLERFSDLV